MFITKLLFKKFVILNEKEVKEFYLIELLQPEKNKTAFFFKKIKPWDSTKYCTYYKGYYWFHASTIQYHLSFKVMFTAAHKDTKEAARIFSMILRIIF